MDSESLNFKVLGFVLRFGFGFVDIFIILYRSLSKLVFGSMFGKWVECEEKY